MHGLEYSHCLRQNLTGICPAVCSTLGMWKSLVPVQRQWNKSSDACLQELHWPTLSSRRNYLSVSMMYDILNGRYDSLKFSDYCNFNTSCTRAHSMTLVPPQSQLIHIVLLFCEHSIFMEHCPVCYSISRCTKVSTSAIPCFLSRIIYFVIYLILYFVLYFALFVVSVM